MAGTGQEEKTKREPITLLEKTETRFREIIREEIKDYMKKWVEKNIYDKK